MYYKEKEVMVMIVTLTKDNIEFPTHYHHICTDNGAVDCCDNEHIKKYRKEGIRYV